MHDMGRAMLMFAGCAAPSACKAGCGVVSIHLNRPAGTQKKPGLALGGVCLFGKAGLSLTSVSGGNQWESGSGHDEVLAPYNWC